MNKKNASGTSSRSPALTVAVMMSATLLSKLLGLLRVSIMASRFGADSLEANAFSAASHIPLSLFDLVLSAAILGCFIPVYNSIEDKSEADSFAGSFLTLILLASGLLAIIGIGFADTILTLSGAGLSSEAAELAARLLRIMFPMIIFTGGTYVLVGVMQSKGRYILPAMVSALSNAVIIIYLLTLGRGGGRTSIYGLAIAYLASWIVQLITLAIPLRASGVRLPLSLGFGSEPLKRAVRMAPAILAGSWLTPVSVLAGLSFASLTDTPGGISVFDCSNSAYTIIAGTLTYSLCNYIFPKLSKLSNERSGGFEASVRSTIACAALLILPFTAAVPILSGEAITVLLRRGSFTPESAQLTASALRFMIIGMPAFALIELLSRIFYSRGMVKIPMLAALSGIAVDGAAAAVAVFLLNGSVESVCAALSLGQWAAAILLTISLAIKQPGIFDGRLLKDILKTLCAALLSGAAMLALRRLFPHDPYPYESGMLENIAYALIIFAAGAVVYLASVLILKKRRLIEV